MNFQIFTSAKIICGSVIVQKVKYLAYHRKNSCGYKLLNKYYTYNHNHCRKHRKFAKLGSQHNRKYQVQNCEKFSPIVTQNWHFSSATAIVLQTGINCSYTKTSKQQLTAHISIVKVIATKCYKHMLSSFKCTHICIGVINLIDSITQNINQINYLQNNITTKT